MQVVEAGAPGPEGRALTLGLHQLPVRPVTQNGQHTSTVVATSLANAYGTVPPPPPRPLIQTPSSCTAAHQR